MPRDFSETRAATEASRKPPTTQAEAMTELLACVVARNECTPEATMDAKGEDAQKLIAAGERMVSVINKLLSEADIAMHTIAYYQERRLLPAQEVIDELRGYEVRLRRLAEFAETGG